MTVQFPDRAIVDQLGEAVGKELVRQYDAMAKGLTKRNYQIAVGVVRGLRWATDAAVEIRKKNEREDAA